jgi:cold shock CspA family protein
MIQVHNNTVEYKFLSLQDLIEDIRHLMIPYLDQNIVSIQITDDSLEIMGEDVLVAKIDTTKPLEVSGTVSWFDESSGTGMIRLGSSKSVKFYSCNVDGADSLYPELVTNIQFNKGDKVTGFISSDRYTFEALGLTNIKGVK